MSENQRSDEENGEKQSSDEESSENQSSCDEEDGEIQYYCDRKERRCILSDPAHPHNLSHRDGKKTKHKCFSCRKRSSTRWAMNFHYHCTICKVEFHHSCRDFPSKMIHSYHPQHPLTFTFIDKKTGIIADTNLPQYILFSKTRMIRIYKTYETISSSDIMFDKCTWCGNDIGDDRFYRCRICNFSLDVHCAVELDPPLKIQYPKSHHHSLTLFPRPLSFPCDACGLIKVSEPSYACYQCNYVVHQHCIDLPRVIKITRHPHRLSHNPFLPTKVSTCRICYKNVDIKYGQYSCNHGGVCSYVAHSKCATHPQVWDGEELEWKPDQTEGVEPPYKKLEGDLIQHFCHHHYLKLEKYNRARDSGKQCQACMRSITSHDDFYSCIECDYLLHEVCANLPRRLDHHLHIHSLFLDPNPSYRQKDLLCGVCSRLSSGWMFRCQKDRCSPFLFNQFMVDINCILVPECFTHESHAQHLLYAKTIHFDTYVPCQGCKRPSVIEKQLHCTICDFAICYNCATIPNEIYYKYDEHPLSLCFGECGIDDMYWCEVCEKSLDPTEWFYANNKSCVTIHRKCLFGDLAYMKSGHTFDYAADKKVEVVGNSSSSPICHACRQHCLFTVYFKLYNRDMPETDFCCRYCFESTVMNYYNRYLSF